MKSDNNQELPTLSSSLQGVFNRKNWSTLWQTYIIVQKWTEIAGKSIAKNSEPAYIHNDTLWVYVESSVLMQHMQPQKLSLLEKINDVVPDAGIQDIRWAMQPARPNKKQRKAISTTERKADLDEQNAFEAMTSTVEDEQCRVALRKLWRTFNKI